jgi:hypothetical protein
MLNYVGYVTGELSRIINTSNPLAWILAPALINRTAEEQSPARSKQSTSRHSSTNLGAYRKGGLEQKILRLRKVDPNIYNDQEVQQAYLTLNKAKQLESLLKLQGE